MPSRVGPWNHTRLRVASEVREKLREVWLCHHSIQHILADGLGRAMSSTETWDGIALDELWAQVQQQRDLAALKALLSVTTKYGDTPIDAGIRAISSALIGSESAASRKEIQRAIDFLEWAALESAPLSLGNVSRAVHLEVSARRRRRGPSEPIEDNRSAIAMQVVDILLKHGAHVEFESPPIPD